jgi:hypothetical protein
MDVEGERGRMVGVSSSACENFSYFLESGFGGDLETHDC